MPTARNSAALLLVVMLLPAVAAAAPAAEAWPRWQAHDPGSTRVVDHSAWDALLASHVVRAGDGSTRFRYAAVSTADRARLDGYLAALQATSVSALARDEQFAYWVNLYNALTVRVVLDHYPVASIRDIDISPGLFADGPWGAKLVEVEGEPLSLDDIEHRILRPLWRDPRVHYAVNCASVGCPDLAPDAFDARRLEAMLEAAAHAFVNHPRGAAVENDGDLVVSSIYDWFQADFGGSESGVIEHLLRHAAPALAERLRAADRIDGYRYDWSLNDAGS